MRNYNVILFIGTGQIGKAILNKILMKKPKKVIIHNLTKNESEVVCEKFKNMYADIEFICSYGNVFMPYNLKDLNNENLFT